MMGYADEEFYKESYLRGKKPVISTGFVYYAREASQFLDCYTFGRLAGLSEIPEEVRLCCCELAEAGYRRELRKKETAGGKTSEKVGTYSVTFAGGKESSESDAAEVRSILTKWLGDTGLLYQGV